MISTLYEPFRHWSENGSVYILSDTHFDDDDCKIMDPNWIDPNEQVRILNSVIMKNDTFVCLGDVGKPEYVKQLKVKKRFCFLAIMIEEASIQGYLMRYMRGRFL